MIFTLNPQRPEGQMGGQALITMATELRRSTVQCQGAIVLLFISVDVVYLCW